jgi:uncharacterized protein YqjF (DUF2071 family)
MAGRPWVWSQHWSDLLFLHWPVPAARLRAAVPAPLEIDQHGGRAWVSLVLFRLRVRPRWCPFLPVLSGLVEANLRTYVRLGDRPGIWFLSVHADNRLAMRIARLFTPMPYTYAAMHYCRDGERFRFEARPPSGPGLALTFCPAGNGPCKATDPLDVWLLERYRLFAAGTRGGLTEAEVDHPPWEVQSAEVSVSVNVLGRAAGLDLSAVAERAHYSPGVRARFGAFRQARIGDGASGDARLVRAAAENLGGFRTSTDCD